MTPTQFSLDGAFVMLCIVQFLGYAQHFVLQPTIPIYVTHLGASPFVVSLVMASFAGTSMLLQPLVGATGPTAGVGPA